MRVVSTVFLFILTLAASGQTSTQEFFDVARELINGAKYCSMVTLNSEGEPRMRVMDPFEPEEDLVIWFGTNPSSRKVEQIRNDSRVALLYFDQKVEGYVTLHGHAEVLVDEEVKKKYWKSSWEGFYPNYPDDYALIKFISDWMEIVSPEHGILGDTLSWTPQRIFVRDKK